LTALRPLFWGLMLTWSGRFLGGMTRISTVDGNFGVEILVGRSECLRLWPLITRGLPGAVLVRLRLGGCGVPRVGRYG
jgi:hypothetical protein